jgi:hypothetical protein
MEPTTLLPVISLLLLVSVEYGGWSLLGFLTGRDQLGEFREQFFRAGHAHAGVLLVLSLVYFLYLDRTGYSAAVQSIGALAILALAIERGRIERLNIGELEVGRLHVRELVVEQEQTPRQDATASSS